MSPGFLSHSRETICTLLFDDISARELIPDKCSLDFHKAKAERLELFEIRAVQRGRPALSPMAIAAINNRSSMHAAAR